MQKQYKLVSDQNIIKKPASIVNKIAANIPHYNKYTFTTRVIDNKSVNAFNTGGLYIYAFTGLLDMSEKDDPLAFVLSHEIGHTIAGHHTRFMKKAQGPQILALLLGAAVKGKGAKNLVNALANFSIHKYSREHEREADVLGAYYAYLAGYDPLAGAEFFEDLYHHQGGKSMEILGLLSGSPLFSTHPPLKERMARIKAVDNYLAGNIKFNELGNEVQYVMNLVVTDVVKERALRNYARKHSKFFQRIQQTIDRENPDNSGRVEPVFENEVTGPSLPADSPDPEPLPKTMPPDPRPDKIEPQF